jgi:DNA-binding transcriptional regulator WhiA
MSKNWNKGLTKSTNISVKKISDTMKLRKIDNFRVWRDRMKKEGKIKSEYIPLIKNENLAELIGVALGDGHIWRYERTEELSIFSNANNPGFIKRYSELIYKVFNKRPTIKPHSKQNCIRIRIYEKSISKRLGVPLSPRLHKKIDIPSWISKNKKCVIRYLRGLYEAEGSYSVHLPTYTHKVHFSNRNESMLKNVFKLVSKIGFHPHKSKYAIQLSKKDEVLRFIKLIKFRKY